jgi:tRNA (adenine57-N1/adenine58-N1)-methyltransferase
LSAPVVAPLPDPRPGAGEVLRAGEVVLLIDTKGREYLRQIRQRRFSFSGGEIDLASLEGLPDGSTVRASLGQNLLVFRPTYARLIPHLPRQAQLIYPKDAASILVWGDIYPGARVVESGVGPGALTMALLRAIGPTGSLVSIDRRDDHVAMARRNVADFYGDAPNWRTVVAEARDGVATEPADRVILDVPEPGPVIAAAADALRPGGILVCYLPTTGQLQELGDALRAEPRFAATQTFETLQRGWHVAANSVRPDHRMVAHTGFVTTAWRRADTGLAVRA